MNPLHEDDLRIAERAAQWHELLCGSADRKPTEQQSASFLAWLEESPRHVREFLLMQAWELETRTIDAQRAIDVERIAAELSSNVVELQSSSGRPIDPIAPIRSKTRSQTKFWRMAAAVALLAIALTVWWRATAEQSYTTDIGEVRTVELIDGSKIQINTKSRLRVRITDRFREVRLLEGEALFQVEPEAKRPFRVHAGNSIIQAVGTQFTVNRRPLGTLVSVIEGSVRVLKDGERADEQNLLTAGEQARVEASGIIERREGTDTTQAASWRQRRLVFRDDALADIAAEFNRYNRDLQIAVEGDTARNKRYGGIFDAEDPESIVRFVSQDKELSIAREKGRIVIR